MTTEKITFDTMPQALYELRVAFLELKNSFENSKVEIEKDETGGIELAKKVTGYATPTIYTLVSLRKIPHSKRGNRLWFSKNVLTNWLLENQRRTIEETASKADNYLLRRKNGGSHE